MEEERMSEFRGAHSIATWRSEVEDEYCSLDLGRRDGEKEVNISDLTDRVKVLPF